MEGVETLTFVTSSGSFIISCIVVFAALILCFLSWSRREFSPKMGLLELLRFLVILTMAVVFNQPEIVEEFRSEEKPQLAILFDDSQSMSTRDVDPKGDLVETKSRQDAILNWVNDASWVSLKEQWDISIGPFATPLEKGDSGTDLNLAIEGAIESHTNLRGIVVISDGDWNQGESPVNASTRLRMNNVPLYSVGVGSEERLPDIEALSLDVPAFGVRGKPMRIPFSVESSLPSSHVTTIRFEFSDGQVLTKDVRIPAMARLSEWVVWKPITEGNFTVSMSVPEHPDESLKDNNGLEAPVSIREEKLKVLVVEGYPRWEYRYLRNALSRDPGVEVSCLLFHPGLSKVGGGNKDYIKAFPEKESLSEYDVIFLGDVGVGDGQLTDEQCEMIKGMVAQQASGVVFMPGWQGRQVSLMDTVLNDLYPVQLDVDNPDGWGTRVPSHFELTDRGRRSHLTKLADTEDENAQVWRRLPGFQWYAPVIRARAGTETLCVHKEVQNKFGRLPLLVTRTFGNGKVLFMGTDGAWRWRRGVEDLYHYRFWGQVVRWMAYQRNMASGESMRLYHSPERPITGQSLTLNANVMSQSGEPLDSANVKVHMTTPSGSSQTVLMVGSHEGWGAYSGLFEAKEPGEHAVRLHCEQTGEVLETTVFVQGGLTEKVGQPARLDVLEEIAKVSRGEFLGLEELDSLKRSLAAVNESKVEVRRSQLWSQPILAGLTVLLLCVFWAGRKLIGEI